jgi:DNA-binding transcriptional MocR family regulator
LCVFHVPTPQPCVSRACCGRVLQVLSSGIRVGFASGPPELINRLNLHSQSTNMHVSGVSQAVVLGLLRHWGTMREARQGGRRGSPSPLPR